MSSSNKYQEYLICQKRKHQASRLSDGEWSICKFCGTHFKYVTTIVEKDIPSA